jgi:hypothetical protein
MNMGFRVLLGLARSGLILSWCRGPAKAALGECRDQDCGDDRYCQKDEELDVLSDRQKCLMELALSGGVVGSMKEPDDQQTAIGVVVEPSHDDTARQLGDEEDTEEN